MLIEFGDGKKFKESMLDEIEFYKDICFVVLNDGTFKANLSILCPRIGLEFGISADVTKQFNNRKRDGERATSEGILNQLEYEMNKYSKRMIDKMVEP